jgi:lipopolysaccharide transport system permease protein
VKYVVPFFVQIWLFVTPVIYPTREVTERLDRLHVPSWLYGLNPMAGVVEGFRWSLLGTDTKPGPLIIASLVVAVLLVLSGVIYFGRLEKTFADIV